MSATTTPPAPPTPESDTRNADIAQARDLPALIEKAEAVDPKLAESLTSKGLPASKSTWGPVASLAISWVVTKYALGWDSNTCELVSGAMRSQRCRRCCGRLRRSPIGGPFTGGAAACPCCHANPMNSATDERAMQARIDHLERRVAAIATYIRERALATDPAASQPGHTAATALRRLDDKHTGDQP